jgi:hypothetical protein
MWILIAIYLKASDVSEDMSTVLFTCNRVNKTVHATSLQQSCLILGAFESELIARQTELTANFSRK